MIFFSPRMLLDSLGTLEIQVLFMVQEQPEDYVSYKECSIVAFFNTAYGDDVIFLLKIYLLSKHKAKKRS